MEENKKQAIKVASAIMPIMSKTLQGLADRIVSEYNDALNKAQSINEKLEERMMKMHDELTDTIANKEKRIAELTEALAKVNANAEPKAEPKAKTKKKSNSSSLKHAEFDKIIKIVKANRPVYLCGPAGAGKTQICSMVADELGLDFYMAAKVADEFALVGYMDGHGKYNDTQFYKAFKFGGVFMFDELDASDSSAVVAMNAAIANGYYAFPNGEMVTAHKDFRVIAAGNTFGTGADEQYTGRQPLDASTLDRFLFVHIDYDPNIELACARGNKDIVVFVHDLRRAMNESRICPFTISYRAITNLVECEDLFGTKEAVQMAIVKGLDEDNVNIISRYITNKDNKYAKAFANGAFVISKIA